MPQLFKIGSYVVYFWINEQDPLEPVHVHLYSRRSTLCSTKISGTSAAQITLL